MTIKGLKKAVGDYQRANAGGWADPRYGKLMFDKSTGEVWTDEFYSIGHNTWKEYHSSDVVCLDSYMTDRTGEPIPVTMKSVKAVINDLMTTGGISNEN